MRKILVAPSILNANFLNLEKELQNLKKSEIEWIHYDVMDFHFVPNLSFGPDILKQITSNYDFKIDLHLMVKVDMSMEEYLKPFIDAKVDKITFHLEALSEEQIKIFFEICSKYKIIPSLSIKPNTSVDKISKYLNKLGNVLVMSVEPGFGGQKFIEDSVEKINLLGRMREDNNYNFTIQVDGGINSETIKYLYKSSIDIVVAGSYLFLNGDMNEKLSLINYVE